jgi:hypothetical protein
MGLWIGLIVLAWWRNRRGPASQQRAALAVGTVFLIALCLPGVLPALRTVLTKTDRLPLATFVDLYVRLRHPHHYYPPSWPAVLWVTFLLPIAIAIPAYRRMLRAASGSGAEPLRRASDAFLLYVLMLIIALLGAGILYVSEPLVQMSLYRFSVYPKLLSCIATAWVLFNRKPGITSLRWTIVLLFVLSTVLVFGHLRAPSVVQTNAFVIWLFMSLALTAILRPRVEGWGRMLFGAITSACVVASLAMSWHKLGFVHEGLRGDDAGYLALCDWAERNTPQGSVFVVPPDEQSFRLRARRAVVVNFKNVPQLSGELGEWRERLENVLDMPDIRRLPSPFPKTLAAIRARYAHVSPTHLATVARKYDARYVVTVRSVNDPALGKLIFSDPTHSYFLYDLRDEATTRPASGTAK